MLTFNESQFYQKKQTMNTAPKSSSGRFPRRLIFGATLFCIGFAARPMVAANDIWTGTGADHFWATPANWAGDAEPSAGDSLFFGGTVHLANTNNLPTDTAIGNITFTSPAGAFMLAGNEIDLAGDLTNNQVITPETITMPMVLTVPVTADVVPNGVTTLGGLLSGSGSLTLVGGGTLNLNGANTFAAGLTADGGAVVVGADTNLGPGNLTLDGGILEATASFTMNSGRGIAVGPGWGGMYVPSGDTLSYGGVTADNGSPGGLTKSGYGTLDLSGVNTYSGPTTNAIGTLVLDFTHDGTASANVINSVSSMALGGGNAGGGVENVAQLIMAGGPAADTQGFASTFSTFGGSAIIATNGAGGTVNLSLGALTHAPGGTVAFVTPVASNGHITTTSANVNGILGGWALICGNSNAATIYSDSGHNLLEGTNFAAVDASGNIVNFTGYTNVTSAATLNSQISGSPAPPNVSINDTASATVVTVDSAGTGSISDVNAINWTTSSGGFDGIFIGTNNTLRLGQYGGIIRDGPSTANAVYIGGPNNTIQSGNGASGSQNVGTLTAGSTTPGEIVDVANNGSETSGTTILECQITDNGSGPVTFVKMGPGSIKLDGDNTFSGGLYLLQGRVQFAGSEIGTGNPDGGGTGPIYVLPGAYLFPSGIGTGIITNSIFVAGDGDAHENLGAFRGGHYSGTITLIGDAAISDGAIVDGPVVGPFNFTLGSGATVSGSVTLNNPGDAWTGNTTMTAESNAGNNTIINGTNNIIPSGFDAGNVTMVAFSTGTVTWNLNGFNQIINGLSSSNTASHCIIENTVASTTSLLTLGGNDQSGTFGGVMENGGGTLMVTKIGGGVETLTGASTYTGLTTINDGSLALNDPGSINDSPIQVNTNGTLDVSGLSAGIATTGVVGMNGGTLIGNGSVGAFGLTNAALTLNLNPSTTNLIAASLATGGSTNLININTVFGVSGYPSLFPIIKYTGVLGGAGNNFGLGAVPSTNTVGYVSNDVVHSEIVLVLLNGPKVLTWTGNNPVNPTFWDIDATTNWIAFKGTVNAAPAPFSPADSTIFDDTGSTGTVSVMSGVNPGFMEMTNNTLTYTFTGANSIASGGGVLKDGTGTVIFDNAANNSLSAAGVLTVNHGTLQLGNNDTNGAVSAAKGVVDNASITFDRRDNVTSSVNISGTGSVSQINTNTVTLSGNSSFSGGVTVISGGTLQAGSGACLGVGTTTISSGGTLDVGGQTLTNAVVVSGAGVGGKGAVINSGAQSLNALLNVTMTADTYFGGTGRWDIRTNGVESAQLLTGGNAYNLFKIGTNQVSIVGATVDSALANINVESGLLSVEAGSTSLGNSADTLTVYTGAGFQLYNDTSAYTKVFVLNGTGTNSTMNCGAGIANAISGSSITLNGNCVFNSAAGTTLAFTSGSSLTGSGSYLQTGAGTNIIASGSTASYTGGTTVSNTSTLDVDGSLSGNVQIYPGSGLAGTGTASGTVTVLAGTVAPGDADVNVGSSQGTLSLGTLTLSNATANFSLDTTPSAGDNDKVAVANGLTVLGTNTLSIYPLTFMNVGDIYTLVTYSGTTLPSTATNQFKVVSARPYFSFSIIDPSTTPGAVEIKVVTAVGNDEWTGATSSAWDITTTNWTRNSNPVKFINGDVANFDDSTSVTNVSLFGLLPTSDLNVSGSQVYSFMGSGSLSNLGPLNLTSTGLIIANTGTNSFPGGISVSSSSTLILGPGGSSGNLGGTVANSGPLTNNGTLLLDRNDNALVINNVISGGYSGSITNIGTGTVILSGANTFFGNLTVQSGTLAVNNNTALGNVTASSTYVFPGATLDIWTNTINLGAAEIYAGGSGVGGNGAIVCNSGSSVYPGANGSFYNLTLTADTTIGGSGRMDMRNGTVTPTLSTSGQPYNLFKVGTNLFQTVNLDVDTALADVYVEAGELGLQGTYTLGLGNPANSVVVYNGGDFDMYALTPAFDKGLIVTNGGIVSSSSGNSFWGGPVTLAGGTNIFKLNSGAMYLEDGVSGPGNLETTGSAELVLSNAPVNYTGNTIISGGTLALQGTASITSSPTIFLGGNTLDASGTTAATLELVNGQALIGGGTVVGSLVADTGSRINPGNGVTTAKLTVGTSVTMNGNVVMNLNQTNAVKADEIVAPSFAASGSLVVTNLGPDLQTGTKFQLFSTNVTGLSVTLPTQSASGNVTYTWQNHIAVDGSITLLSGAPNLTPAKIIASVNNGNITLTWPTNQTGWSLQMQTNSLSVGISTNWMAVPGSTITNQLTMPINTSEATFFRLTYQP